MTDQIDLSGLWELSLEPEGCKEQCVYSDSMELPGTTSAAGKGAPNPARETGFLTDAFKFGGTARVRKTVQFSGLQNKTLILSLERTRITELFVDGESLGVQDSLIAPHRYDISRFSADGEHELVIAVTNVGYKTGGGHLTSQDTQSNWCGITGHMRIEISEGPRIYDVKIYTSPENRTVTIKGRLFPEENTPLTFNYESVNTPEHIALPTVHTITRGGRFETVAFLGNDAYLWSDETPYLYRVVIKTKQNDTYTAVFGLREFRAEGSRFTLNGRNIFLRGKHDGMIFPKTGYAPTDVDSWLKVMGTAKEWGFNHYRFHTCCPPEAAFEAADRLGIIMEPQLPFWGTIHEEGEEGYNKDEQDFLIAEGFRMIDCFGNHPSFCMMSMGNELWGSQNELNRILRGYKDHDRRRLYTQGSNNFQWFPAVLEEDDFFVGVRLANDRLIRGSYAMCDAPLGHVQTDKPSTMHDYDDAVVPKIEARGGQSGSGTVQIQYGTGVKTVKATAADSAFIPDVPIITHEIGQYETFPDLNEINKYTGPLKARNFEIFRERLDKAGLLPLAQDYFRCSGQLAVQCYKEELEAAFRSERIAGFQLLDLQDFSGQGTALVGMLAAFRDPKGLIEPQQWRQFCNDAVVLARFGDYCLEAGADFSADIELAWFRSDEAVGKTVRCELSGGGFEASAGYEITGGGDHIGIGRFTALLPDYDEVTRLTLTLSVIGTDVRNSYELTVFPRIDSIEIGSARIFTSLDSEARALLDEGRTVLIVPETKDKEGYIDGFYCTDFWCYPMFRSISESMGKPVPVGTMGLLIDSDHPALAGFSSRKWSTPQWYDIVSNSRSEILDGHSDGKRVIVRTIDNFERNHDLALLYEYDISNGKAVVLNADIEKLTLSPEGRTFVKSVIDYVSR